MPLRRNILARKNIIHLGVSRSVLLIHIFITLGLPKVDDNCMEYDDVLKFSGNILKLGINISNIISPFVADQKGTIIYVYLCPDTYVSQI